MTDSKEARLDAPGGPPQADLQALVDAIGVLSTRDSQLAGQLARLFAAIATEAGRGPRLANALTKALREPASVGRESRPASPRSSNRRNAGPFDPFTVRAEGGEKLLREQLTNLSLDQLRDIVAEHGMDNDRLAMKWKDPQRVIDRIIERVNSRSEKGSAFRA